MPRVAGIDIPDQKPIEISLRYIYGLGPKFATDICREAGIDGHARSHTLSEDQLAQIGAVIESNYVVEGALRRQTSQDISRLRDIRCYRGDRHRRSLPAHGQRTKTNARTRKGRKRTVTGKKSVKTMK